ncbi:MAG: helix-turn-helix transcriptional regulator [Rhizobiaceae bacterium]
MTVTKSNIQLDEITGCQTTYDLFRVLRGVTESYGYKCFMIMQLPSAMQKHLRELVMISNWPAELIRAYDELDLLRGSPVKLALEQSSIPFNWELTSINKKRSNGHQAANSTELFTTFGLVNGVCFPLSNKDGMRVVVSFTGDRQALNQEDLMELSFTALHAFEQFTNLNSGQATQQSILTKREKECVFWTAEGKTSSEISQILSISTNTVNHHLSSAATKLNTMNKAHTVAKAITLGLMDV